MKNTLSYKNNVMRIFTVLLVLLFAGCSVKELPKKNAKAANFKPGHNLENECRSKVLSDIRWVGGVKTDTGYIIDPLELANAPRIQILNGETETNTHSILHIKNQKGDFGIFISTQESSAWTAIKEYSNQAAIQPPNEKLFEFRAHAIQSVDSSGWFFPFNLTQLSEESGSNKIFKLVLQAKLLGNDGAEKASCETKVNLSLHTPIKKLEIRFQQVSQDLEDYNKSRFFSKELVHESMKVFMATVKNPNKIAVKMKWLVEANLLWRATFFWEHSIPKWGIGWVPVTEATHLDAQLLLTDFEWKLKGEVILQKQVYDSEGVLNPKNQWNEIIIPPGSEISFVGWGTPIKGTKSCLLPPYEILQDYPVMKNPAECPDPYSNQCQNGQGHRFERRTDRGILIEGGLSLDVIAVAVSDDPLVFDKEKIFDGERSQDEEMHTYRHAINEGYGSSLRNPGLIPYICQGVF